MLVLFFLCVLMFFLLDSLLVFNFSLFVFYCYFYFYVGGFDGMFFSDFLSFLLVLLSVWVFLFSIFSIEMDSSTFFLFVFMMGFSIVSFFSTNYLIFYLSFEFVFVFMFFYLINWGSSEERLQACFYMFFYTLLFSLPFFLMLMECVVELSGLFFFDLYEGYVGPFWVFMFLVFMAKLPLFGLHVWLPKAHVQASVAGSMVLAGVLLKLGGYGFLRFLPILKNLSFSNSFFISLVFYLSLYGGLFGCCLCISQMDLKMLIAYSSIVHMSVMYLGLSVFSDEGVYGSLVMMFSHGLISPLLFFMMTNAYEVKGSRSAMVLKGGIVFSPLFCLFWFLSSSLNMSVPPFMSFFSEFFIFGSLGLLGIMEWFLVFLVCFFTGVYCIFMYVSLTHGDEALTLPLSVSLKNLFIYTSHLFFVLFYPLFFFIN